MEDFGALIQTIVGLMQIELSIWGFTFTFWQILLFGLFVSISGWFIGGFFND